MCGRYTSTSTAEQLVEVYHVDEVRSPELPPRWNVAPSQPVYAIAERRPRAPEGTRQLGTFRWGLVPSWAKDPSVGNRMINARADTVMERPAFRSAFARRRCIIPADAFYEWQALPAPAGRASVSRPKQPWAVRRNDGQPMAFAGLWEVWREPPVDPDAPVQLLRSCAIITTEANAALASIHHRMPVVLPQPVWDQWLDPANDDLDGLQALLVAAPERWFETFPVSSRVNSVTNEGPELLDPPPPDPPPQEAATEPAGDGPPRLFQPALFDVPGP